ncbi:MAG: hypothetical protein KAT32_01825 [Candidatus Moranbacteria bacterium]|nr:hypothetical protein [Candidatus Moranbacteria bacterium]
MRNRFEGNSMSVSVSPREVKKEIDEGIETHQEGEQLDYNIEEEVPVFDKDGNLDDWEYYNSEGNWGFIETEEGSVTKSIVLFDNYQASLEEYSKMIGSLRSMNRGKRNHPDVEIYNDPMNLYFKLKEEEIDSIWDAKIKPVSENQEQLDFLKKLDDEAKKISKDIFINREGSDIYFEGIELNSDDINDIVSRLNAPRKIGRKMIKSPIASDEHFQERLELELRKFLYKMSVEKNLLPETSDKMEYVYETRSGYEFRLSNSNLNKIGFDGGDGSKYCYSMFFKPGLDKRRNESQ